MVGHQIEKSHVKTLTIKIHITIKPGSQANPSLEPSRRDGPVWVTT